MTTPFDTRALEAVAGVTSEADLRAGATVWTVERAREIVDFFARVTTSQDVDRFLTGFTEDCEVHVSPFEPARGLDALRALMGRFFSADRLEFRCDKQLRAISGDVLGVVWTNRWVDRASGRRMRSKGVEFWQMRGDRIARWDAAQNAWPE
jgi:hypothetical protein